MPRPKKWRRVDYVPPSTYFKPAGVPVRDLQVVELTIEEVEALRLKEVEGLEPVECAERMCISRPTFHRVLSAARRKVAEAIVTGKALSIQGGAYLPAMQMFVCAENGHKWQVPFSEMAKDTVMACPQCNSTDVQPVGPFGRGRGHGCWGWRRGRGGRRQP